MWPGTNHIHRILPRNLQLKAKMSLPTRKIGNTDVSAIGYGAMGIAIAYGNPLPEDERLALLDEVYNRGCRFWDTADIYGDSEESIGKWYAICFFPPRGCSTNDPLHQVEAHRKAERDIPGDQVRPRLSTRSTRQRIA